MNTDQKKRLGYTMLVVLGVAFVAAVMASSALLRGIKLDLTENNLYTLAPGTRSFLEKIGEPINVYLFFSDRATAENNSFQGLRLYENRVREMLEEFEAAANGGLRLSVIDPVPFSDDEDRAAQFGLRDLSLGTGDSIYFGLAATNSVGEEAIIEVFDPNKENALEYDVARLLYSLANPQKNVVGLLSGVPMTGGFNPETQQPQPPWTMSQQARQLFDVRNLPTSFASVDPEINMLWIVHPQELDDQTLYAIDQYLLGGGRALIFVDPLAEVAALYGGGPVPGGASSSTLEPLFSAWGLRFDPARVVVDERYGLSVDTGTGPRPLRHIGLIGLDAAAMNQDDLVTTGLESVNMGTAGSLSVAEGSGLTLTPLVSSSTDAALMDGVRFQFLADPEDLLKGFAPTGQNYVLAARLGGTLKTAFPDGPPAAAGDAENGSAQAPGGEHLSTAENPNVIVVADVDVLSDRLWVQVRRSIFGQQVATAFASNGDFVANALANLAGSSDLIGLRSRATFSRPFSRVEDLRREADARFRETEQRLEAQLSDTEKRLGELQATREDTNSLLMSPEQQAEIQRFEQEQLRIRRDLRTVRRELDSSIEQLGATLKIVNILAVPLALSVLGLMIVVLKRTRRGAPR